MKPVFVTPAVKNKNKISFFQESEQIIIGPEDTDEVLKIFKVSDGSRDINQISKETKVPINKVNEIISQFEEEGIVFNSEKMNSNIICDSNDFTASDEKIDIIAEIIGIDKPVKRVWINVDFKNPSFYSANAIYYDPCGYIQFAGATSTSSFDALFKAAVEGYERWQSSQIRVDKHSALHELDSNKILPYDIAPLTRFQAEKSGVTFFEETMPIDWTLGTRFDGERIYVPSDMVFYGHQDGKNRIYYGNSSGIAAFTNEREAKKRALVELIERDALMKNWFSRKSPNILSVEILPETIKKRITKWEKQGRKLFILEIPSQYGIVIESIFVSDQCPCFVSGAAATINNDKIHDTIKKAVDEAEFNLEFALQSSDDIRSINKEKILYPVEHGRFYYSKQNAKTINWLWSGKVVNKLPKIKEVPLNKLCEALKTVFVDLSDANAKLKVIKMISPKLVPINFGFYTPHYLHPEIDEVNPQSLKYPHYFS